MNNDESCVEARYGSDTQHSAVSCLYLTSETVSSMSEFLSSTLILAISEIRIYSLLEIWFNHMFRVMCQSFGQMHSMVYFLACNTV